MTTQIAKSRIFYECFPQLPPLSTSFAELMLRLDQHAVRSHGQVSQGALANSHGAWFEWLLGIIAWNVYLEEGKEHIAFTIPNVRGFDATRLYKQVLFEMVAHLRSEVKRNAKVELITSNPDFVIVKAAAADSLGRLPRPINEITGDTLSGLDSMYLPFRGNCDYADIVGYAGAKYSLRPDRRLQIPHEGSLIKALHVHMQTRMWITDPQPLRYYAISASVSESDRKALRTVATHSITNVSSLPTPAVDDVFQVLTLQDAWNVFDQIL